MCRLKAFDYILGFTCLNDISQRNLQNSEKSGWFRGKSLDTFGPVGPCIVLTKDIGDAQHLAIKPPLKWRDGAGIKHRKYDL